VDVQDVIPSADLVNLSHHGKTQNRHRVPIISDLLMRHPTRGAHLRDRQIGTGCRRSRISRSIEPPKATAPGTHYTRYAQHHCHPSDPRWPLGLLRVLRLSFCDRNFFLRPQFRLNLYTVKIIVLIDN
jgi:hypothetical protein